MNEGKKKTKKTTVRQQSGNIFLMSETTYQQVFSRAVNSPTRRQSTAVSETKAEQLYRQLHVPEPREGDAGIRR